MLPVLLMSFVWSKTQQRKEDALKLTRSFEAQVKDAQNRLDEAEQNALKGGRKLLPKWTLICELESELDAENGRSKMHKRISQI